MPVRPGSADGANPAARCFASLAQAIAYGYGVNFWQAAALRVLTPDVRSRALRLGAGSIGGHMFL